jgi:hypothetical protein
MAMTASGPVTCARCGQTWPRDPALEVPCPHCRAPIGSPCRRPSGHGCELHASRDQAALDAGVLAPCPGESGARKPTLLPQEELPL